MTTSTADAEQRTTVPPTPRLLTAGIWSIAYVLKASACIAAIKPIIDVRVNGTSVVQFAPAQWNPASAVYEAQGVDVAEFQVDPGSAPLVEVFCLDQLLAAGDYRLELFFTLRAVCCGA